MKSVHKSVLIWHSAPQMFALVADVERYPRFLPWCNEAAVLERTDDGMVARVGMSIGGIRKSFTTRNRHQPDRQIAVELVDGPFSHLDGVWDFKPVGEGPQAAMACRIDFTLHYAFSSQTLAALVGPVFDKIAGSLVDAFVKRADEVYGA